MLLAAHSDIWTRAEGALCWLGRFGRPGVADILRDSGMQHATRVAALQQARTALEAKLRTIGMFRLEVPLLVPQCFMSRSRKQAIP